MRLREKDVEPKKSSMIENVAVKGTIKLFIPSTQHG